MGRIKNMEGQKHGRLKVLSLAHVRNSNAYWLCLCDCGINKVLPGYALTNGTIVSCGCYGKEQRLKRYEASKIDNMFRKQDPRYKRYYAMLNRCNPSLARGKGRKNYADLGINVCDDWKSSFSNFCRDMGECPERYELDRIDNSKGYSKENCRWVPRNINQFNKRTSKKNTAGVTGVCWHDNRWRAYITVNKKQVGLGRYKYLEDAKLARKKAELEYYGFNPVKDGE